MYDTKVWEMTIKDKLVLLCIVSFKAVLYLLFAHWLTKDRSKSIYDIQFYDVQSFEDFRSYSIYEFCLLLTCIYLSIFLLFIN